MKNRLNCVLLIDDDRAINFLHRKVVENSNCAERIETLESAEEALDYLRNAGKFRSPGEDFPQPQLIFLDIEMPGMDGWAFMEKYSELPSQQKGDTVLTMLTTSLNPQDKAKAENLPEVNGFLTKPLTVEMMADILERFFPEEED